MDKSELVIQSEARLSTINTINGDTVNFTIPREATPKDLEHISQFMIDRFGMGVESKIIKGGDTYKFGANLSDYYLYRQNWDQDEDPEPKSWFHRKVDRIRKWVAR